MSKERITKNKTLEKALAQAVYNALRRANSEAVVSGEPTAEGRNSNVLIDGNFNFRIVARFARKELERLIQS